MPLVVKSAPHSDFDYVGARSTFVLPVRSGTKIHMDDSVALFSAETSGGDGLYGLGIIRGKGGPDGFLVELTHVKPKTALGKSDFASLNELARTTPIEKLNGLLYYHSHNKVAEIDSETYQFLAEKFS